MKTICRTYTNGGEFNILSNNLTWNSKQNTLIFVHMKQCISGCTSPSGLDQSGGKIRVWIQSLNKGWSGLGSQIMSSCNKFEVNLISGLSANAQKLLHQLEVRKQWEFYRAWAKIDSSWISRLLYTDGNTHLHGANMGSIWGRQDPGGPHVGPMNFVIWVSSHKTRDQYPYNLNKNGHCVYTALQFPEQGFQYKDCLSSYKDFHYKDKTVVRPSYLYDGNANTG